jgi:hypothetical protein
MGFDCPSYGNLLGEPEEYPTKSGANIAASRLSKTCRHRFLRFSHIKRCCTTVIANTHLHIQDVPDGAPPRHMGNRNIFDQTDAVIHSFSATMQTYAAVAQPTATTQTQENTAHRHLRSLLP